MVRVTDPVKHRAPRDWRARTGTALLLCEPSASVVDSVSAIVRWLRGAAQPRADSKRRGLVPGYCVPAVVVLLLSFTVGALGAGATHAYGW